MTRAEGLRLAAELGLSPLPDEGGLFRRTHLDEYSSAIHYLLLAPDFSALHVLDATEVYHFYGGAPLRMLLLGPAGDGAEVLLGPANPQVVVPAGTWQGSSSDGEWSWVGTTVAPPFEPSRFRLGDRTDLAARYPAHQLRISQLTRL